MNRERIRAYHKRWRERNRARCVRYQKSWGDKNPDYRKAYWKRYYEKNRVRIIKGINDRQKRTGMQKVWKRKYYRRNPLRWNLRSRLWAVLKARGVRKNNSVVALLGCSITEFKGYIEKKFKKGMTWHNRKAWHLDHIVPCAAFDLSKEEEQHRCFHYTNFQPLWAEENMRKSDSLPEVKQ